MSPDLFGLAVWFAGAWRRVAPVLGWDDLRQTVWVGLLEAWRGRDQARGEFSTFAKPYVKAAVCEAVRRERLRGIVIPKRDGHRGTAEEHGVEFVGLRDRAKPDATPPDPDAGKGEWERFRAMLTEKQVRVVWLRFAEGRTQADAAAELGISSRAVQKHEYKAAARLRSHTRPDCAPVEGAGAGPAGS